MAIITLWNDNTGKIGQTYSAIALSAFMAIEHNYKILLMSTKYNDKVTRQAFTPENKSNFASIFGKKNSIGLESGLEGMNKLVAANRLTPNSIPDYTRIIYKNRLEIVSAPQEKEDVDYDKLYANCWDILTVARRHYDVIILDLNNGLENRTTKEILQISDIIILNIEQKLSELKKLMEIKEDKELFPPNKILTLINNYDRRSKYSSKNITREIGEKKEILTVPYCNLFSEAVQEGYAADFFLNTRLKKLEDSEDRTTFFMKELKRDTDTIIYKMQELQMRI